MKKKKKQKSYGTSGGVELTDELIQKLADEAEAGYDISRLRSRGRRPMGSGPATVFQVRLEPELLDALQERAQAEHTTPSEIVRRLLRGELGLSDPPSSKNTEVLRRAAERRGRRVSSKRVVKTVRKDRER